MCIRDRSAPDQIDPERVGLAIHINAGMAINTIESRTHPITTQTPDQEKAEICLTSGRTLDTVSYTHLDVYKRQACCCCCCCS